MSPWRTALRNRGLVRKWVRLYRVPAQLVEDAEQQGVLALVHAAERWDPLTAAFSTYAFFYVRKEICTLISRSVAHDRMTSKDNDERRRQTSRARVELDPDAFAGEEEPPDTIAIEWLRRQVAQLDPHRWSVLRRVLAGRSSGEIASAIGISRRRVEQIEAAVVIRLRARVR